MCKKILSLRRFYAGAGGGASNVHVARTESSPNALAPYLTAMWEGLHIRGAKVADPSLTLGRNLTKGDIIVYVKGTGSLRSLSLKVNGLSLGTPKGGEGRWEADGGKKKKIAAIVERWEDERLDRRKGWWRVKKERGVKKRGKRGRVRRGERREGGKKIVRVWFTVPVTKCLSSMSSD